MILLITYDKSDFLKNYAPLYSAIKSSNDWWHHLDNTWLISTELNVRYWFDILAPHINNTDRLLIVEITPNYQGWLNKDAWKWIQNHFEREGYSY